MVHYFDSARADTILKMSRQLIEFLHICTLEQRDLIFLCIGSDRSTGDSLGPILGYKLCRMQIENVYGTLEHPVHAANLSSTIHKIQCTYNNPFIIAIDASLGMSSHVGFITLGHGPLTPGLGVQKKLPEVGDIHITGIVNSSDCADCSLLQTTHLYTVVKMADMISNCLYLALHHPDRIINVCSYTQQQPDQLYPQRLTS